jgi:hypothetical protein
LIIEIQSCFQPNLYSMNDNGLCTKLVCFDYLPKSMQKSDKLTSSIECHKTA